MLPATRRLLWLAALVLVPLLRFGAFVPVAYANGVPMGGDPPPRDAAASPAFAVWACKDAGTPGHPRRRGGVLRPRDSAHDSGTCLDLARLVHPTQEANP